MKRPSPASVAPLGIVFAMLAALVPAVSAQSRHPSELFEENCAKCHGMDGKAQTPDGKKLGAEVFASRKWQEKKRPKKEKLINSVTNGHGSKMPAFKDKLTPEQIRSLVENDVLFDWDQ
jgi:mono/diheme cytochrome c family protein